MKLQKSPVVYSHRSGIRCALSSDQCLVGITDRKRQGRSESEYTLERAYVPAEVLDRISSLLRPSDTMKQLTCILFYLVTQDILAKGSSGDLWFKIRKFLSRNDLELILMFFDLKRVGIECVIECRRRLCVLDELEVIRCGDDASCLYSFLLHHLT